MRDLAISHTLDCQGVDQQPGELESTARRLPEDDDLIPLCEGRPELVGSTLGVVSVRLQQVPAVEA